MKRAQNGGPGMNAWHEGGGTTALTFLCYMGIVGFKLGFWLVCSLAKAVQHRRPALLLIGIDRKVHSKLYSCLLSDVRGSSSKEWIKFLVGYLIFFSFA
ncbi:hypothetical protein CEXT_18301 [Caerostris extrusa]|uniref:Uncharacterized protein n=1 Tax=Caerostris extrusa TaxID=172846 RepID=A0AAV4W0Y5_CAEEX|nr:hypothetical protein CEXT_18301 [Caerostris extrusa]